MDSFHEFKEGIELGRLARKLFTELRLNNVDPWDTMNPDSPYFKRSEPIRTAQLSGIRYLGHMIGQLMNPMEWYKNAEYLFGTKTRLLKKNFY